jgi:hypothetical protein
VGEKKINIYKLNKSKEQIRTGAPGKQQMIQQKKWRQGKM